MGRRGCSAWWIPVAFAGSVLVASACSPYGTEEPAPAPAPAAEPPSDGGSDANPIAADAGGDAPRGCDLPWGGTLAHGESVKAFAKGASTFAEGACVAETRLCFNGTLSGSYGFETCVAEDKTKALLGSNKTLGDCLAIGGQIAQAEGGYLCKRASNSCWNGWSKYKRWSTTSPKSCTGSCVRPISCTTPSHAWADANAETCTYTVAGARATYCNSTTCTATTVAVGCN